MESLSKRILVGLLPLACLLIACGPSAPQIRDVASEDQEAITRSADILAFNALNAMAEIEPDADFALSPIEHLRLVYLLVNLTDEESREQTLESVGASEADPIAGRRNLHALINDLSASRFRSGSQFFLIWPLYTDRIQQTEIRVDLGAEVYRLGSGRRGAQLRYLRWSRGFNPDAAEFEFSQDDFGFPATAAQADLRLDPESAHLLTSPGTEAIIMQTEDGHSTVIFAESAEALQIALSDIGKIAEPIELPAVASNVSLSSEIDLSKLWPRLGLGHLFEPPTNFRPLSTDVDENYHLTVGRSSTQILMRNAPLGRYYFLAIERNERMTPIVMGRVTIQASD